MPTDETAVKHACLQVAVQIVMNNPPIPQTNLKGLANLTVDVAWHMWQRWDAIDKGVTQPNTDLTP